MVPSQSHSSNITDCILSVLLHTALWMKACQLKMRPSTAHHHRVKDLGSKVLKNSGLKFWFRAIFRDFWSRSRRNHFVRYRFFPDFLIKETEMRHRCDSRIIYYLTLMTLKTPEITGTKSTGRNFSGILNLVKDCRPIKSILLNR
jgi:hypothetical protein